MQMQMVLIYNWEMNSRLSTFASRSPDAPELKPGTSVVSPSALGVARLSSHAIFAGALEVEMVIAFERTSNF